MNIQHNISLQPYNTFGIDVTASHYAAVTSIPQLKELLHDNTLPLFILGGGSNMLLTKDIEALVLHIQLKGISILKTTNDHVWVEAQAGENWHEFVVWCLEKDFGGIENLSLIPGNIGTAPIQNIGAYGVELKDVFDHCKAVNINTLEEHTFTLEDCRFGYRDSIFKNSEKGNFIITSVILKLTKNNHELHTKYGAIADELSKKEIKSPTIQQVSQAVISIRKSKLPDPKELGNSGSFFKNPVIPITQFKQLQIRYPSIPSYSISDELTKVPAGWLIEQCGFKGKRFGDAGIHQHQALVLVNYGKASGEEIWEVAKKIQK